MTNEQLVLRIQAGENVAENMAQLWEQTKDFISQQARKYQGAAELEDLEQEGFLGLCRAVDHYTPDCGAKFLSYAAYWIRQGMNAYLYNNGSSIRIPVNRADDVRKYQKAIDGFLMAHGRKPTEAEIRQLCHFNDKDIECIPKIAEMTRVASLDKPVEEDPDSTTGDFIADPGNLEGEVLDRIQQEELKEALWLLVEELPEDSKKLIHGRYHIGLTWKEVGEMLGITPDRVRKLEQKAIHTLRVKGNRKLTPFLNEYIGTHAFHGNGVGTFNQTWTSSTERVALDLL